MDFSRPQSTQSINGFAVTFRQHTLENGTVVWVPRGISRNEPAKCWRIYLAHEDGVFTDYVFDDPSPRASLEKAFEVLVDGLNGGVSPYTVDRRRNAPGMGRDPLIDTGFTGVTLSRAVRRNRKSVVVVAEQAILRPDGEISSQSRYVGSVSESDLIQDPIEHERRFITLLEQAVHIRRYYNQQRSLGVIPEKTYEYADVPADIRQKPVEFHNVDIQAIMDSFVVVPRPLVPITTGGDPEALAIRLQSIDLSQPRKPCYLEGRYIRFPKTVVDDEVFYLPKQIFRARDQWRIKLAHSNGWFCDSVHDSEFGHNKLVSLYEAWTYLVSLYRAYDPPNSRTKSVAEPLISTGITRTFLMPHKRTQKTTGKVQWTFTLSVTQEAEPERSTRVSIGYWRLEEVTDENLCEALCRAEATVNYREHLLGKGASLKDALVRKDTKIPKQFWPDTPQCPIYADDLRYYVEQREKRG